jgi:hypothetical protein
LLWFVLLGTCCADDFILYLRNGDRITGTVLAEDDKQLTVTNALVGKVLVPISQIEKREKAPPAVTPSKPPEQAAAKPVQATPTKPVESAPAKPPQTAAGKTNAPPAAPPKPKAPPPKPKEKRWHFDIQLGANIQYNQRTTELYYGNFKVNYAGVQVRHIFEYKVNYGRTDGEVSADNMNGLVRTEIDITKNKRVYLFNAAGAGYDEIRKIDLTYDDSLGVGYKLITRTNFVLNVDTGFNYQQQYFSNGTSKEYFSLRLAEKATWKISPKMELSEQFEFFPRSVTLDNYRLRFESNYRYVLNSYLNLNLTVIDQYDTNPAPGVTPNDLQIRSTVGVKF